MNIKSMLAAIALSAVVVATPAAATLQTINIPGTWIGLVSSDYQATDVLSLSVTYNDETGFQNNGDDVFFLTGPGAAMSFTIGTESWGLADYDIETYIEGGSAFLPAPAVVISPTRGTSLLFVGTNANGTMLVTGLIGADAPAGFFVVAKKSGILVPDDGGGFETSSVGGVGTFVVPASPVGPPPVPGVPEPSTWAMLMAGFGLVGAAVRRRQALATA